ncbi:hypothetical protein HZC34_07560 [Candidatus Saganbacteria bacterium]|nr:hypothetical protein [Candidatus Saganbacteria bacterium]
MVITKKDIENIIIKFSAIFATKQELQTGLNSLKSELKNDILTSQDKIMKKLEDLSIEQKMSYAQSRRQEVKLENHEERIKHIEEKVLTSN